MLSKEQGQAVFDRLDAAGLDVTMRHKVERVETTAFQDAEPQYKSADGGYRVSIKGTPLDAAIMRLVADQAERQGATIRVEFDEVVIR